MDLRELLAGFAEDTSATHMQEAATQLIDLLDEDLLEPIHTPGEPILAEELANRLERRVEQVRRRGGEVSGIALLDEALAHLRANDGSTLSPYSYEDSEELRWVVLVDEDDEILACYHNGPFIED